MEILVVGAGRVGLVSALCFAEIGHFVTLVDNDRRRIKCLRAGQVPIHEELLPLLMRRHCGTRLNFSTDLHHHAKLSDIVFITVETPPLLHGRFDLSAVEAVGRELASALEGNKVIVERTSVPAGTCDALEQTMVLYGTGRSTFSVACNPEFLREGTAVHDFLFPDRIVIGADCEPDRSLLCEVYRPLTDGSYYKRENAISGPHQKPARLISTSVRSAELIKHATNAFLAMKISFINAVANLCERVDADVREVCDGIGSDSRIGRRFLHPGIGYGGSRFSQDVLALRALAQEVDYDFKLLTAAIEINAEQKLHFLKKVQEALWNVRGKRLAVLGLAFKGGTDDVRDSPALDIVSDLLCSGASIVAFDPAAMVQAEAALPRLPNLSFASSAYEACAGADALLVLTEWQDFYDLDLLRIKELLRLPILLDAKNHFNPLDAQAAGLNYYGVGNTPIRSPKAVCNNHPAPSPKTRLHLGSS